MAEIENLKIGNGGTLHIVGNEDIVANAWQAGKTYVKNKSYVIQEHRLYVCNVTHTSVEPFDATKWTEITIGDAIGNNIGDLSQLTTSDKSSVVGALNEVNRGCLKSSGLRVIRETLTTNNNGTIDSNTMTGGAIPLSRYILSAYSPNGYFVKVGYYSSRYTFDIFDNTFALVKNTNVEICVIAVESLTL